MATMRLMLRPTDHGRKIDPDEREVTVLLRREADGVASWEERVFRDVEVIVGDLLPGFAGTVAELWADLE